jgi:hypothetical protein
MTIAEYLRQENERLRRQRDRAVLALARVKARPVPAEGEPPADDADDGHVDLDLDARSLDRESYRQYLQLQGIDAGAPELTGPGYTSQLDPRVVAKARARAEAALKARSEALKPGAVDARSAEPGAVVDRLRQLGIHDVGVFLPPRQPEPEAPERASAQALRQRSAREEARKRVMAKLGVAQARNVPFDSRSLPPDEYAELVELRGLGHLAKGTTSAGGSPPAGARY